MIEENLQTHPWVFGHTWRRWERWWFCIFFLQIIIGYKWKQVYLLVFLTILLLKKLVDGDTRRTRWEEGWRWFRPCSEKEKKSWTNLKGMRLMIRPKRKGRDIFLSLLSFRLSKCPNLLPHINFISFSSFYHLPSSLGGFELYFWGWENFIFWRWSLRWGTEFFAPLWGPNFLVITVNFLVLRAKKNSLPRLTMHLEFIHVRIVPLARNKSYPCTEQLCAQPFTTIQCAPLPSCSFVHVWCLFFHDLLPHPPKIMFESPYL